MSSARAASVDAVADAAPDRPRAVDSIAAVSLATLLALGLIVLLTTALHLWGLVGDLPYAPDIDEPTFMGAAVGMLAHHTLNPGWFGHPGSTIIYPSAALIEVWYLAAKHLPPFAHPMPGISRELVVDPMPFYVIGRLVSAAYAVCTVVVAWLLGRRILGDLGGLLAALLVPATAIVIQYGQLMRSDTAGMFFAVLALWLAVRAMERGRGRDWVLTAIAIGLAISSRYIFATLVAPYVVAAVLSVRWTRRGTLVEGSRLRALVGPLAALLVVPIAFALTSPFVVLEVRSFPIDGSVHPGADGLSPIGNLLWYIGTITPSIFGWAVLSVSAVGVVALVRSRPKPAAVLIAFVLSYLVGVSASPLHWDRYIIPLVPVVGVFMAAGVLAMASAVAGAVNPSDPAAGETSQVDGAGRSGSTRRWVPVAAAIAIIVLLLAPSIAATVADARQESGPSTRAVATDWVARNLAPESRIAQELSTTYLPAVPGRVLRVFALADRSLAQYRADGYRYLITTSGISGRFDDMARYPRENAFYRALASTGHLVASFEPGPDRSGDVIGVYDLGPGGG